MKSKKIWRFKTREEFIKEFGENWSHEIQFGWAGNEEMDHFLGQLYTGKIPKPNDLGNKVISLKLWSISSDMLTTRQLPKILPDGTIVKVGMKLQWTEYENKKHTAIVNKLYLPKGSAERVKLIQIICCCHLCVKEEAVIQRIFIVPLNHLQKFPNQPKALIS